MPFDLARDRVKPLLESWERRRSQDATAAWDWLTASGDAPEVSLHELEYFLWYQLPAKFLTSHEHHRAVALALADLLDALGHADAASLCRGFTTMQVLAEWESDPDRGHRAFIKALDESGVHPPNTDVLEWGAVMLLTEARVLEMAANELEDAISHGVFTPGERGWKHAQSEVTRQFLLRVRHDLDERSPREAVWQERIEYWALRPARPSRELWLRPAIKDLRRSADAPEDASAAMLSLHRLLELAGEGIPLTQAGFMQPAVVRQLVDEFGWWHWGKPPRNESDALQVHDLRDLAKRSGLLRVARKELRLTANGRHALADTQALWRRTTWTLARGASFSDAIGELLLARLLRGPVDQSDVREDMVPVLAEAGWTPRNGGLLTADMVGYDMWDAIRPLALLNMLQIGKWPDQSLRLTRFGAISAREILRLRATAPVER
ncbi:MAG: hypothetical protein ACREN2_10080 [Candidatus Dormibacteria bacterium]